MGYFLKPRISFGNWFKQGLVIVLSLSLLSGYIGWQLVRPASRGLDYKQIIIKPESNLEQISQQLRSVGLVHSPFWFKLWLQLTGRETEIFSGYYSLPGNVNIINLTNLLTSGQNITNEIQIRLVEGWTIKQMAGYLESNNVLKSKDFINTVTSSDSTKVIAEQISGDLLSTWPGGSLQGYLFPDTYRIYKDSNANDIAVKMIKTLDNKFLQEWRGVIGKRGLTVHQVITLASIVEKEVATAQDRKKVADIFLKRLKANMGLQADSTINYITGKSDSAVQGGDLSIDSPYNTYKYKGLPPGPISNPGLSAIEAVIYPTSNDYWYFLTTSDGRVIYSKTYTEHLAAKAKYLR